MKQWKVYYFEFGDTQGTELKNLVSARVTKERKATSNVCELILSTSYSDFLSDGDLKYKPDETLKVYANDGLVDVNNASHLMGVFTIQNPEITPDARTITLQAMDKTYDVLSKIWLADVNDTLPNIIQNMYDWITNTRGAATVIDSTRSDGSAFTNIEYFSAMKTAYEVMQEISQPNYTGDDREYLFWVDENGVLYWTYPGQTPLEQRFTYGSAEVVRLKAGRTESNVVSMIIYNAGKDLNGNNFVDFYLDPNATQIKGRMMYQEMLNISKDLQETTFWTTATNEQVQNELKRRAEDNCRRIVNAIGTGLWEVQLTTKGKRWQIAQLHNINAADFGFPTRPLRVNRIVHRFDKGGWETDLVFEEDVEALEI